MDRPSCWNCSFLYTWDIPATREDPGDSGYECGICLDQTPAAEAYYHLPEAQAVEAIGGQCHMYSRVVEENV